MEQRNQEAWGRFVAAVRKAHEAGKDVGVGSDNRRWAIMAADEWMRSLQEEVEGLRWALGRKDKYIESIQAEFFDDLTQLRAELAAAQKTIEVLHEDIVRLDNLLEMEQ